MRAGQQPADGLEDEVLSVQVGPVESGLPQLGAGDFHDLGLEQDLLHAADGQVVDHVGIVVFGDPHDALHHGGARYITGQIDAVGQRPHVHVGVGELGLDQHLQLTSVGRDDDVDRVEFLVLVPDVQLRDARMQAPRAAPGSARLAWPAPPPGC